MGVTEGKYGVFKYLLYAPDHLDDMKNLPMVVVLHGSGEIGSSLSKLKKREPYLSLKNGKFKPDCWVLMPQLPKKTWGYYASDLIELCNELSEERTLYADNLKHVIPGKVNPTQISLTGHSLGGMGVIEVMLKYPAYFSAGAVLSCCKDYSKDLPKLSRMPLWFIHGSKESKYGKYARAMYKTMNGLNTTANYSSIPGYGHPIQFVWTSERYELFKWLTSWNVGDLRNPTWHWLLRDLNILDDDGKLNQSLLDHEIEDPVARAFALKKSNIWPL